MFVIITEEQAQILHSALVDSHERGDDSVEELLDLLADDYRGNAPDFASAGGKLETVIGLYRAEADITDVVDAVHELCDVMPELTDPVWAE